MAKYTEKVTAALWLKVKENVPSKSTAQCERQKGDGHRGLASPRQTGVEAPRPCWLSADGFLTFCTVLGMRYAGAL